MKRDISELRSMQALPLDLKVSMTKARIRQWVHEYDEEGVYIALSGGKDSTVLSHIVDDMYPDNHIPRVHVRTGLEYPEIEKFCETFHDLVILKPKMTFKQVIEKYGYPFISKEVSEAVYGAKRFIRAKIEEAQQASKQASKQGYHLAIGLSSLA